MENFGKQKQELQFFNDFFNFLICSNFGSSFFVLSVLLDLFLLLLPLFKHFKELDPMGPDLVRVEKPTEKELEPNQKPNEQAHRSSQEFGHIHLIND